MNTIIRTKVYTAIYCALGAAALCASSTSVQADEENSAVRFADLNIYTPEGAKVLYDRIDAAAKQLCEISVGRDPNLRQAMEPCVNKAIDNAVKEINAPYLTALRFGSDVHVRVTYN